MRLLGGILDIAIRLCAALLIGPAFITDVVAVVHSLDGH